MIRALLDRLRRRRLVGEVRRERLTYLERPALEDLWDRVREIERTGRPGMLLEAGCALGGSSLVMAGAKSPSRPMEVYDVFGMIPPPSEADGSQVRERYDEIAGGESEGIDGDRYYGYEDDLLGRVTSTFDRYGMPVDQNDVRLVKGLYEDTLRPEGPVALAHIDCDWYESVKVCLDRIVPRVVPGGVLVIDDYGSWAGAKRAVDEYFDGRDDFSFHQAARLQVVRAPA